MRAIERNPKYKDILNALSYRDWLSIGDIEKKVTDMDRRLLRTRVSALRKSRMIRVDGTTQGAKYKRCSV
jgi:hypothetical protein